MNNKAFSIFLISLSFFAGMILAVPNLEVPMIVSAIAVAVGIVPICIALFAKKDKNLASKTIQPFLIVMTFALLKLLLDFIFFIAMCFGDYQVQYAYVIVEIILAILIYVLLITVLIFFCLGKDAPVLGNLANKILDAKKENKKSNTKIEDESSETKDSNEEIN